MEDVWKVLGFTAGSLAALYRVKSVHNRFDPLIWLENVDSEESLGWVREKNEQNPFKGDGDMFDRLKEAFDSTDKIPYLDRINDHYYNFWQDELHVRGIWRRTTLEEFRKKEPKWETVLDLDALSKQDNQMWVWHGSTELEDGAIKDRALVELSPGGTDAAQVREFDLIHNRFFEPHEQPFSLPAAKTRISYKDKNTVLVGTDFGPGSLTNSGYPRVFKEWKRGEPLSAAKTIFEGDIEDVYVHSSLSKQEDGIEYLLTYKATTFYTSKKFVHQVKGIVGPNGENLELPKNPCPIHVPDDASLDVYKDMVLLKLRSEWKGFQAGSLLAAKAFDILSASDEGSISPSIFTPLFVPSDRTALLTYTKLKSHLLVQLLDNIKSRMELYTYKTGGQWIKKDFAKGLEFSKAQISTTRVWPVDSKRSDEIWITSESFVEPTTYGRADVAVDNSYEKLRQEKARFNAANLEMNQFEAESLDGTKVPYFQVNMKSKGGREPKPTLLYSYGGFEISLRPSYQITTGICWLEQGNTYVCANIRGGGEFGPTWHQAALKANRNKAYEDFEAVAKDLVRRGVTTNKQLGIMGGSNGGLLMGNMLTRSPELFGAIVCMVPLLDMKRYSMLLAGASWMAEYGDPSTSDWENFLHKYSPYHNLRKGVTYPPFLVTTSTRDDRVHPGHARKMVKKMLDMGIKDVFYWENIEGGHGGSSTNAQRAQMWATAYQFLHQRLKTNLK